LGIQEEQVGARLVETLLNLLPLLWKRPRASLFLPRAQSVLRGS